MKETYTMEDLLNLSCKKLTNVLIDLPNNEDKKKILQNPKIREKYFTDEDNHYPLVYLFQGLYDGSLPYLVDEQMLELVFNDKRSKDKMNALMTCRSLDKNNVLANESVYNFILKYSDLQIFLHNLNDYFAENFINYILDNNLKKLYVLGHFLPSTQIKIVNNPNIFNKMMNLNDFSFIACLNKDALESVINNQKVKDIICESSIYTIISIIEKGVNFPYDLQNNEDIINKYLDILDMELFRAKVNSLQINNHELFENITKKRIKNYNEDIKNINFKTKLLPKYQKFVEMYPNISYISMYDDFQEFADIIEFAQKNDKEEFIKYLQEPNKKYLYSMLIDRYFEEMVPNFLINLKQMLNFLSIMDINLIDTENLKLYFKLLNYENLTVEELVELYKELDNGKNYVEIFYNDYRNLKNISYQELNSGIITGEDIENKYSYKVDDVKVLELHGEPFMSIGHASGSVKWNDGFNATSLSLIGDKHISFIYNDYNDIVYYGFDNIPIDQIMHVFHTDSFSNHDEGSDRVNEIHTKDSLIENTKGYNEILFLQNSKTNKNKFDDKRTYIKPKYIIAINEITKKDILAAKNNNIPILLIHLKDYTFKYGTVDLGESYHSR